MQCRFHARVPWRMGVAWVMAMAFASAAWADAIHPRWIGVWFSETKQRLGVSEQQFNPGTDKCKWAGTRPGKTTSCAAFYEGSISKAQLTAQVQQAEKAALDVAQRKSIPAADVQSIKDDFKRNHQALDGMPGNVFKVIKVQYPDDQQGASECSDYFFIDFKNIYNVISCDNAPDAFAIRTYKKS